MQHRQENALRNYHKFCLISGGCGAASRLRKQEIYEQLFQANEIKSRKNKGVRLELLLRS